MDQDQLRALLEQVRSGEMEVEGAISRMRHLPFEDLGFAKVDHHRALRHGCRVLAPAPVAERQERLVHDDIYAVAVMNRAVPQP